jgi:hypothetical protein
MLELMMKEPRASSWVSPHYYHFHHLHHLLHQLSAMRFESSLAFEASWINFPKWKERVPANTHKRSSEKQSCSTCRQEESIEKLMTKFQAKVESFWNLLC